MLAKTFLKICTLCFFIVSQANAALPAMLGSFSYKLQGKWCHLSELSGLCLSKDGDFLWGVGDDGRIYNIQFDGKYTKHNLELGDDAEGITINPLSGDLYVCVEPNKVFLIKFPYKEAKLVFSIPGASQFENLGIEGIAWYKGGNLYLGAQTRSTLWKYSTSGKMPYVESEVRSLASVAPGMTEIADLCYDAVSDRLWVLDSTMKNGKFPTIYLLTGDAKMLLSTYSLKNIAISNPEAICVDRVNNCIWIGEDCGENNPSILHKIEFGDL